MTIWYICGYLVHLNAYYYLCTLLEKTHFFRRLVAKNGDHINDPRNSGVTELYYSTSPTPAAIRDGDVSFQVVESGKVVVYVQTVFFAEKKYWIRSARMYRTGVTHDRTYN
jgi:hypothetical protein